MQKILYTADWHIKLGQKNVPTEWQRNRFRELFSLIEATYFQKDCELLIVGGDIFDRAPTIEELELYFEFLSVVASSKMKTIIYPGNHEAVKKNTSFLSNLKSITSSATGGCARIIDDFETVYGIDFIPYNRLRSEYPASLSSRVLCTHVRGAIPPHVQPEVPLEQFSRWEVVLAGDLHSYENCQANILYPGSPMPTSFHRNPVTSGVIIFDLESLKHEVVVLKLPQLIRKTVTKKSDMVRTDYDHTIYELEGDMADMAAKVDSDLLDKKIVRKESKSSLQLHAEMSIKDELGVYLTEVMKLDKTKVAEIQKVYDDNIKETTME